MPHSPPVPTTAEWRPGSSTWLIGFSQVIESIPGVPDLLDWVFHRGIVTTNPTSITLESGKLSMKNLGFNGTEFELDYLGPPPSYYDVWSNAIPPFMAFAIPA